MPSSHPRSVIVLAALSLLGLAAGCDDHKRHASRAADVVQVSVSACGQGWRTTRAGDVDLRLHNTDSRPGEAQLIDPRSGAVYADVEPIGPGTTVPVHVRLSGGSYAVRCLMEDEAAIVGRPVSIHGTARDTTPGVVPIDQASLIKVTQAYQRYVAGRLPRLAAQVGRLQDAVAASSVAQARSAWLTAHATYETLGAAYDAFGDLDDAINGLPDGLPRGVADPGWSGFHRIEYGLWQGKSTNLVSATKRLRADVRALQRQFKDVQIEPRVLTIRAHEITENALSISLTGRDDFGSHSDLSVLAANLDGTRDVLTVLRPIMRSRKLDVAGIDAALGRARHVVRSARPGTPIRALPTGTRERLDAAFGDLAERLAPVAATLEPRKTS